MSLARLGTRLNIFFLFRLDRTKQEYIHSIEQDTLFVPQQTHRTSSLTRLVVAITRWVFGGLAHASPRTSPALETS